MQTPDGEVLFLDHLPLIRNVIRSVCRRHRVSADEESEFASRVLLKLIDNDYAVLRQYAGRSGLRTYLFAVVYRHLLDWRNSCWGKWRPSSGARRLGGAAVRLEQLIVRDAIPATEAEAVVAHEGKWGLSTREVEALRERLPVRAGRPKEIDVIETLRQRSSDRSDDGLIRAERRAGVRTVRRALAGIVASLGDEDRRLLKDRFRSGRSVADIARASGADQKTLYRRIEAILRHMRSRFEAESLTSSRVMPLVGHPDTAVSAVLKSGSIRIVARSRPQSGNAMIG